MIFARGGTGQMPLLAELWVVQIGLRLDSACAPPTERGL